MIKDIEVIGVIGAGIMGEGVAQNFAQAGCSVRVLDISADSLKRCEKSMNANLRSFAEFDLLDNSIESILSRVQFVDCTDLLSAVDGCDFIVEAMPEVLELKQSVFKQLDELASDVILASNTSSMTISNIGSDMQTAERLIGVHYFNPAHIIPAVEIHTGDQTSAQTVETTMELMTKVGKKPVLVKKEIPGFIINRLTGAMEREIDYLLDNDVVSPEDLDTAVKASYGFRLACMGPMEAEDMIGLDTAARASANIFPVLSKADDPSPQLLEKVERGELGIKTGSGWYDYPESQRAELIKENNHRLLKQLKLFNQTK